MYAVSFFKVVQQWEIKLCVCGQIISVCNSERIIKIGQYMRKLCTNDKGSSFLTHSVDFKADVYVMNRITAVQVVV